MLDITHHDYFFIVALVVRVHPEVAGLIFGVLGHGINQIAYFLICASTFWQVFELFKVDCEGIVSDQMRLA